MSIVGPIFVSENDEKIVCIWQTLSKDINSMLILIWKKKLSWRKVIIFRTYAKNVVHIHITIIHNGSAFEYKININSHRAAFLRRSHPAPHEHDNHSGNFYSFSSFFRTFVMYLCHVYAKHTLSLAYVPCTYFRFLDFYVCINFSSSSSFIE